MTKIKNKLLISFILVSLIPLLALGGYGLFSITNSLKANSINRLQGKVRLVASEIHDFLSNVKDDLFFLRDCSNMQALIAASQQGDVTLSAMAKKNLEQDFLAFSKNRKIYYQIRYLDASGMEVVRIDRIQDESVIIPEERLQNKQKRYYFADTAKLPNGKLMISPLDLNREHGEIEKPLRPVIRYATPIYSSENVFQGIVILNVLADHFLDFVQRNNTDQEKMVFVDKDGFYYFHPDSSKQWGGKADLNSGENFRIDYKSVASQVIGSFKSASVYLQDNIIATEPVFLDTKQTRLLGDVVSIVPGKVVFKAVSSYRNIFILIGVIVFCLTILIALALSRSITTPLVYLTRMTQDMSRGKLGKAITVTTRDEIKQLADSIERLRRSMIILLKRAR